jgi:hypothetical protein
VARVEMNARRETRKEGAFGFKFHDSAHQGKSAE